MERDDARIVAVLRELADLGRRLGERAGELATLTAARQRACLEPPGSQPVGSPPRARAAGGRRRALSPPSPVRVCHGPRRLQTSSGTCTAEPVTRAVRRLEGKRPAVPSRVVRIWPHGTPRPWLGPAVASGIGHLVVLLLLAAIYVAKPTAPPRVVIELGEATDAGLSEDVAAEPILLVGDELPPDSSAGPPATAEPEPAVEPFAIEPFAIEPLPVTDVELAEVLPREAEAAEAEAATGALLAEIAAGGSGAGEADAGGVDDGGAGGRKATDHDAGRARASFFGRVGQGRSVCFICDNSNSHRDGSFHAVLEEVARAVDALRPEQSFYVIFASDAAYPLFHPAAADTLQPATGENKRRLRTWLGTVEMCRGGQGLDDALRLAAGLDADVVYLLSDGDLGGTAVERLVATDVGRSVVHTFGVQQSLIDRRTGLVEPDRFREQQGRNRNLEAIAAAHGGTFTTVLVPPQVAALERLRPIPRNRTRGGVWGLRL